MLILGEHVCELIRHNNKPSIDLKSCNSESASKYYQHGDLAECFVEHLNLSRVIRSFKLAKKTRKPERSG